MSAIWHGTPSLDMAKQIHVATAVAHLGIEFVGFGDDWLSARMPVDDRTVQPTRVLHGGASVLLAETVGSMAAALTVDLNRYVTLGQEINANHLRPVTQGWVTGTARPVHLGRRSQVWGIEIRDEADKLTCISRITMAIVEKPEA
ncbi:MAG: hotdog fold thioesterase [Pseudomonadota bacterium]